MKYFEHYDDIVTEEQLGLLSLDEDLLIEMANLEVQSTGLPYKLWIDQEGACRNALHNHTPRLKVQLNGKWIPMEISDTPDIPKSVRNKTGQKDYPKIQLIKEWVKAYKPILEAHYFGKISNETAIKLLKKIEVADASKLKLDQMLEVPREIIYYYDDKEMLWFIEVVEADKSTQTYYVEHEYELSYKLSKLQHQYKIDKIRKVEK